VGIHPTKIPKTVIRPLSGYLKYPYPYICERAGGRTSRSAGLVERVGFHGFLPTPNSWVCDLQHEFAAFFYFYFYFLEIRNCLHVISVLNACIFDHPLEKFLNFFHFLAVVILCFFPISFWLFILFVNVGFGLSKSKHIVPSCFFFFLSL
jgi:hypothetical protein